MSVITNKEQLGCCSHWTADTTCLLCKEKLGSFPYLEWDDLFLCASCCAKSRRGAGLDGIHHPAAHSRRGLLADIIHCAAIHELQQLGLDPEMTLVRESVVEVQRAARRERQDIKAAAAPVRRTLQPLRLVRTR